MEIPYRWEPKNLGPDAPVTKNESGGPQSEVSYRFDLIDPKAIFRLAGVLEYGAAKYGVDNWRLITTREHLNHALIHAYAHMAGDTQDDHLGHFFCRAMMALAMAEEAPATEVAPCMAACFQCQEMCYLPADPPHEWHRAEPGGHAWLRFVA